LGKNSSVRTYGSVREISINRRGEPFSEEDFFSKDAEKREKASYDLRKKRPGRGSRMRAWNGGAKPPPSERRKGLK